MYYYIPATSATKMAIIHMRHPHEVQQPSPRKSNIHPPIFKPQPRRLKISRPMMMITMIPTISILYYKSLTLKIVEDTDHGAPTDNEYNSLYSGHNLLLIFALVVNYDCLYIARFLD